MNRVKKYIKSKGIKLENDYPFLPYTNGLEAVIVNSEKVSIIQCYPFGDYCTAFDRNGNLAIIDNE